jgi:hypothetical protein
MKFMTARELFESKPEPVEWVCEPWLALEAITELDGAPKSAGKTTFALAMCKAILMGADFLGHATVKSGIVYLTEESGTSFRAALERAGIGKSPDFHVLFWKQTHGIRDRGSEDSAWAQVLDVAVQYAKTNGAAVLVVDTFAQFARLTGDGENSAGDVLRAMLPLQKARDEGMAVLVIRHERKGGGAVGESGRGSNAMSGVVDIVLQLKRPEGSHPANHRKIDARSRFDETPLELTISLTDGEYRVLGEADAVAVPVAMKRVLECLPTEHADKLSVKQLQEATGLPRTTLQSALKQLESEGSVVKSGSGKKGDAIYYLRNAAETPSPKSDTRAEI